MLLLPTGFCPMWFPWEENLQVLVLGLLSSCQADRVVRLHEEVCLCLWNVQEGIEGVEGKEQREERMRGRAVGGWRSVVAAAEGAAETTKRLQLTHSYIDPSYSWNSDFQRFAILQTKRTTLEPEIARY